MTVRFLVTTWVSLAIATAMVGCGGGSGTSSTSGSGTTGSGGGTGTTGTTTTTGAGGNTGSTTTSTGSTTASTSSGLGGSAQGGDCGKCVTSSNVFGPGTQCEADYKACAQDQTCNDFLTCADQCLLEVPQSAACWTGCEQAAAAVLALYQPFVSCICSACKADCNAACP